GELVGADIQTAPSLRERDEAGNRHRAFDHCRQLFADRNVLGISRIWASNFLRFVQREDSLQVVARVGGLRFALYLVVFCASLTRSIALRPETPAIALGHQLALLVVEFTAIDLLYGSPREAGLMLD